MTGRFAAILITAAALGAGCGAPEDFEAERRREAFRVPKHQLKTSHPSMDRVGAIWSQGDTLHYQAVAETDPVKKRRLLSEAAKKYEQVLAELTELRRRETDPLKREEFQLLILKAREDLDQALRNRPITGE